jgi:hypothetical protein
MRLSVPICLTLFAVSLQAAITDGIVAHFRFDETTGTTAADTIRGQPGNGTLHHFGQGRWAAGQMGGAVALDGNNDWISLPNPIADRSTAMTFSGWVWAESLPAWASITKNWGTGIVGQFHFGLDAASGRLSNYLTDGTNAIDPAAFPVRSWQHVAFTYDGSTHRVYRNGIQVASRTTTTTLVRNSAVAAFGCKTNDAGTAPASGAAGHWNGRFDDFGFWNRALSPSELAAIHHYGRLGISVGDPFPPLISTFTASPPNLRPGETTTLTWSVENATSLTIHGGPFDHLDVTGQSGITTPPLSSDVMLTLTAANADGNVVADLLVGVGASLLEPVINEFLASNQTGLRDAAIGGESVDWIEIHNPNPFHSLNLEGYHLTDNPQDPSKWTFPSVIIAPGGHLVVFASGKDRAAADGTLHANFSLSADGEYLALLRPGGQVIVQHFSPAFPPQSPDISYAMAGYLATPTPGAPNSGLAGPRITGVTQNPPPLEDTEDLTISARILPQGTASVSSAILIHRTQFGTESSVPMTPGASGHHSAVIPAAASAPGQMVRWRILATDSNARISRAPLFADPTNSPEYFGTVVADPSAISHLPILHRFVQNPSAINNDPGTRCSLWFNGDFFDNLEIRIRGNTSRAYPKKSHKIEMNSGHRFLFKPDVPRVTEFNLNTTYTDKSYVRSILASEMQRSIGMPSAEVFPVQVRQNGSFHSVALFTENPDTDFLQRHGIDPGGAFYKAPSDNTYETSATFEKRTRLDEPGKADLDAHIASLGLTGTALETYVFDHVDLPAMVDYIATTCITQNIDASDKNHYAYRDTNGTGEWSMIPWDLDLTFGPNALNTDTIVHQQNYASHPFIGARPYLLHTGKYNRFLEAIINTPRARAMIVRRIRSLSDHFLATHTFENRIDQLVPLLSPDVALDHARWGSSSHFGGITHTLAAANQRIKSEYLAPRAAWLNAGGAVGIPGPQAASPQLAFGAHDSNPVSNNQDQEFIEIVNPGTIAVDVSGWSVNGGIQHVIRPGTVIPAGSSLYLTPDSAAFRRRAAGPRGSQRLFVQGGVRGHLSNFGETLTLDTPAGTTVATLTTPSAPSDPQRFLVISELMYKPRPDGDAEFVELMNISPTMTLDLGGVTFSSGIRFTFEAGTTLPPLARILVVKSLTSFISAHGDGHPVAGEFANSTSLNNGGERIKLDDASGSTIVDFTYDEASPWPTQADGNGSLVLIAPRTRPDPSRPENWRASMTPIGNPGTDDALHFSGDPAGDDDQNGWSNLIEYAFGNDPVFTAAFTPEGLALTAPYIPNADDVRTGAEVTLDLITWVPAEIVTKSGSTLTFRAPPHLATEPRLFIRATTEPRPLD